MILYHGNNQIVQYPSLQYADAESDFGPGFYHTGQSTPPEPKVQTGVNAPRQNTWQNM